MACPLCQNACADTEERAVVACSGTRCAERGYHENCLRGWLDRLLKKSAGALRELGVHKDQLYKSPKAVDRLDLRGFPCPCSMFDTKDPQYCKLGKIQRSGIVAAVKPKAEKASAPEPVAKGKGKGAKEVAAQPAAKLTGKKAKAAAAAAAAQAKPALQTRNQVAAKVKPPRAAASSAAAASVQEGVDSTGARIIPGLEEEDDNQAQRRRKATSQPAPAPPAPAQRAAPAPSSVVVLRSSTPEAVDEDGWQEVKPKTRGGADAHGTSLPVWRRPGWPSCCERDNVCGNCFACDLDAMLDEELIYADDITDVCIKLLSRVPRELAMEAMHDLRKRMHYNPPRKPETWVMTVLRRLLMENGLPTRPDYDSSWQPVEAPTSAWQTPLEHHPPPDPELELALPTPTPEKSSSRPGAEQQATDSIQTGADVPHKSAWGQPARQADRRLDLSAMSSPESGPATPPPMDNDDISIATAPRTPPAFQLPMPAAFGTSSFVTQLERYNELCGVDFTDDDEDESVQHLQEEGAMPQQPRQDVNTAADLLEHFFPAHTSPPPVPLVDPTQMAPLTTPAAAPQVAPAPAPTPADMDVLHQLFGTATVQSPQPSNEFSDRAVYEPDMQQCSPDSSFLPDDLFDQVSPSSNSSGDNTVRFCEYCGYCAAVNFCAACGARQTTCPPPAPWTPEWQQQEQCSPSSPFAADDMSKFEDLVAGLVG